MIITDAYLYVAVNGHCGEEWKGEDCCVYVAEQGCFCKYIPVKQVEPEGFRSGLLKIVREEPDSFFFVLNVKDVLHVMKYPKQLALERFAKGEIVPKDASS